MREGAYRKAVRSLSSAHQAIFCGVIECPSLRAAFLNSTVILTKNLQYHYFTFYYKLLRQAETKDLLVLLHEQIQFVLIFLRDIFL